MAGESLGAPDLGVGAAGSGGDPFGGDPFGGDPFGGGSGGSGGSAPAGADANLVRLLARVSAPVTADDPAPPKSRASWALIGVGVAVVAAMLMAHVLRRQQREERAADTPAFERLPPGERGCPPTANFWGGAKWPFAFPGETVAGRCAAGTRGTITRKCKDHMQWDDKAEGECALYCVGRSDANAIWADSVVGERVAGKCMTGYEGAPARDCLRGGEWGAVSDACTQKKAQ